MYSDSLPLLTNCTYLNTAYVGPMSTTLSEFRRKLDEDLVQNGGDYKVRAYEALEETHEIIANFFGAYSKQSFIVPHLLLYPHMLFVYVKERDNTHHKVCHEY